MKRIRVLMFGWEFQPMNNGGLGTACYGLTKALAKNNIDILFVMPRMSGQHPNFMKLISLNFATIFINSPIREYITSSSYQKNIDEPCNSIYGKNLFEEVYRYSQKARLIASSYDFDIIHAHDWLTFQAGVIAKEVSGKPLVLHVHSIEYDRTGGNGSNSYVENIEKDSMNKADCVIAVSNYTKSKIIENYHINENKIEVIHNSIDIEEYKIKEISELKKQNKIVLFLGRVTLQKGPEYFVYSAAKVLKHRDSILFIITGDGDMLNKMVSLSASLGISDKVLFPGFLRGDSLKKMYKMADLFVMPSVSEPFGLTALEAISNNVPVIISKQSGVSEVLNHCLKINFWDIDEMSNKIISVLDHSSLHNCLSENSHKEVSKMNWNSSANKCITIYNKLLNPQN